jgi:class 3 adenylate cyclase
MPICASCGRENADDARFCSQCGTALAAPDPAREQRKVVTVLFCDLVGSTALGESTDPEALRARMRRYFEDLRAIIERHGGVVEKFVNVAARLEQAAAAGDVLIGNETRALVRDAVRIEAVAPLTLKGSPGR